MPKTIVATAGAGLTGASWAGLFAATGLETRLYDARPAALAPAAERAGRAARAARFLAGHDLASWTEFPADSAAVLAAGLAVEKAGRTFEELTGPRDGLLAAGLAGRRQAYHDERQGAAAPRPTTQGES